ncbi:MAG: tetratricopeptide repeat protein [Caldilineaceae bacterium]
MVKKNPADWERIDPLYGQIKRALHIAPDDESLLDFVRALATYQERRGLWDDRIALIEQAVRLYRAKEMQPEVGQLLYSLGAIRQLQGAWAEAVQAYTEALAISHTTGDPQLAARVHVGLGRVYTRRSEWSDRPSPERRSGVGPADWRPRNSSRNVL